MNKSILRSLWTFGFVVGYLVARGQGADNPGQIAPELVGKWCYLSPANGGSGTMTNTCFTLNEDGSYEFVLDDMGRSQATSFFPGVSAGEKDFGTWSVQGNSIYYNSSANGKGTFQFQKMNQPQNEGTPMIVVHGQAFVSVVPHDPW